MLAQNIPLKRYSNFKIGGPASYFFEFKSKDELLLALSEWNALENNNKILVIGGGTNILFSDDGFDGLVLKDSISYLQREGNVIDVGSGTLFEDLVSYCVRNSLSGFEWAGGLPGSVGGAVRGNAGAFRGEAKDNLIEVESMNLSTFVIKKRNKSACQFDYRKSVFKNGDGAGEIILSAKFKLTPGDKEKIKKETQEKVDYRISRHPLDLPNIGSVFKNVPLDQVSEKIKKEFEASIKNDPFPILPVAKLLIAAGLLGHSIGGAKFSEKHPNFIVNYNSAKAQDVRGLITLGKKKIKDMFNISLEEEIIIL